MRPDRTLVVVAAGLLILLAGTLSACGSVSTGGAPAARGPSWPGQQPPSAPPDVTVVRLGIAFSPAALRLRTGARFRLIVTKTIQAGGPGVPRDCRPGARGQVPGGLVSVRCVSSREYLYTAEHAGTAILSATVQPNCPPGTACPMWVAEAGLKITIT